MIRIARASHKTRSVHFSDLVLAASGLLVASAVPGAAWAQDTTNDPAATSTELEGVVVTGSRLIRKDFTAVSPVVTLDSNDLSASTSGNVTVEQTLNELPQLVADNTGSLNAPGGAGVWTADLRGLGAVRTLVLVDGRRFTPASTTGLVDLASIPTALLEKVEIISGGAAAVYGSDAVAGAINFLLKRDFQGVEARYFYGETGEGDGQTHEIDLTLGDNFAEGRGNAVINFKYTERSPVMFENREFARIPLIDSNGVNLVPSGSSTIPGTRLTLSGAQLGNVVGVDFSPPSEDFGVQSGLGCTAISGVRFGNGGQPVPFCNPEDNYNYAEGNYLLRPLERYQFSALGHYDLTDNVRAFSQLFYMDKKNSFQRASEAKTIQSAGAPSGTLIIPDLLNSPVYPQVVRDYFAGNSNLYDPDGDGNYTIINAARRYSELGPRIDDYSVNSWNVTFGLQGDQEILARKWKWEVFGQKQRTDQEFIGLNQVSSLRIALGLDVVVDPLTGQATCRVAYNNCVPINLFGVNSLTPEMASFLATPRHNAQQFDRQIAGGSISGDLLDLPAGALPVALGFEVREDKFSVVPSSAELAGEFDAVPPTINGGDMNVSELFAETRIPLLKDLPFISNLDVELGARYSDYSTIGNVFTWKAGLEWGITPWARIRGMANRAVRAPNLEELYGSPGTTFSGAFDPCDMRQNPSQARRDFCVLQGIPAADINSFVSPNSIIYSRTGGNQNLKEEESDTLTVGVLLSPPAIPRLNIAIDYYRVEVDDAIAGAGIQSILNACFAQLDQTSVFCQAISRFPTGEIDLVDARQQNISTLKVDGLDVQLDYRMALPDALAIGNHDANLSLRVISSWQFENSQQAFVGQPVVDCAGYFGGTCSGQDVRITPDQRGQFSARWASGPLAIGAQLNWIGKFEVYPGVQRAVKKIDPMYYASLNASVSLWEKLELSAGVDNVFDKQPPVIGFLAGGDPNTDPSAFDVLGRRYFAAVRMTF